VQIWYSVLRLLKKGWTDFLKINERAGKMRKLSLLLLVVAFGSFIMVESSTSKKAGGTIIGKVNNTIHGGGVEGARVTLTSDGASFRSNFVTITDSSGYFTFSGLPPGRYKIKLSKRGFFSNKVGGIKVEEGTETKLEIGMIVKFGGT
jgi:hypothetical protein